MEDWATVALVLGSNGIMGAVNWLVTKRQTKHSEDQFEKEMQAEREVDKHKRRWEVRSEPLMKLRDELACMAEKFGALVDLATRVIDGGTASADKRRKDLEKAVKGWDAYFYSGEFYRAIHMQYDYELKFEVQEILLGYNSAYFGVIGCWHGGNADEKIGEAKDVIRRNAARISAVQSKINKLLEEL